MNQKEKAKRFAQLHVKGTPLILYNAWDAGSARSVLEAGAKAIATSSWSVAAAQGYQDGEAIPIQLAEEIVGRARRLSIRASTCSSMRGPMFF
jgi:2-methylisocitrate lyase-like PEP mutase family enzyme